MFGLIQMLKELRGFVGRVGKHGIELFYFQLDNVGEVILSERAFGSRPDAFSGWSRFFPLITVPAWLLAVSIIPAVYHSALGLRAWFVDLTNVALVHERTKRPHPVKWYQGLYAVPGWFFGLSLGLLSMSVVAAARVIRQSASAAWQQFAWITHKALESGDKDDIFGKDKPLIGTDRYFGWPGILLGTGMGVLGFLTVGIFRVIKDSTLTTWYLFAEMTAKALPEDIVLDNYWTESRCNADGSKNRWKIYGLGMLGIPGGIGLGIIGFGVVIGARIVGNTLLSAWNAFAIVTNLALFDLSESDQLSKTEAHLMGVLGYIPGALLGLIGFGVVVVGRVIGESMQTTYHVFAEITNLVLESGTKEDNFGKESRTSWIKKYVMGSPGLLLGLGLGVLGATVALSARLIGNSVLSAWDATAALINLALIDLDETERFSYSDPHSRLGMPGYVIGAVFGVVGFVLVFPVRMVLESIQSSWSQSVKLINYALASNDKLTEDNSVKHWYKKYVLGLPGLMIGTALGAMGYVLVQGLKNNTLTAYYLFARMTNEALDPAVKNTVFGQDKRTNFWHMYGLGVLGIPVGFGAGILGFATVGIGRVIGNTALSAWDAFAAVTNIALLDQDKKDRIALLDDANKGNHWLGGWVGVPIGACAGMIGFVVVGAVRVMSESMQTSWHVFSKMVDWALPQDSEMDDQDTRQSVVKKYIVGFPGVLLGIGLGALGVVVIGAIRITVQSILSTIFMTTLFLNLAWADKKSILPESDRSWKDHLLGLPGAALGGLVIGPLFFVMSSWDRIRDNVLISAWRAFVTVTNLGLMDLEAPDRLPIKSDVRTKYERFLGSAGALFGGVVGILGFVVALGERFVVHNIYSGRLAYHYTATLADEVMPDVVPDLRHGAFKYLVGAPGLLLGGAIGLLVAASIEVSDCFKQSASSFLYLSGSFLNANVGHSHWKGLQDDQRQIHEKWAGLLGYGAALLTTVPLSAMYFMVVQVALPLVVFSVGAAASLVTASYKAYKMFDSPRFKKEECSDVKMNQMKNLYASLNVWGNFEAGKPCLSQQTGGKGPGNFVRKMMFFNIDSMTEWTLDAILLAYKTSLNQGGFFEINSAERDEILQQVKAHYKTLDSRIDTSQEIDLREKQIEKIVDFVWKKVKNEVDSVPKDLYPLSDYSWSDRFFGKVSDCSTEKSDYQRSLTS